MRDRGDPVRIVTLVHGTYAPDAAWTLPGSALREALVAAFGDRLRYEPFPWNGANNVFDRIVASAALADHLDLLDESHPGARHVLIAHSHGGNLALQALWHGGSIGPVDGVCCLATPFFHARVRDDEELSAKRLQSIFFAILTVPLLFASPFLAIPLLWTLPILAAAILVSAVVGSLLHGIASDLSVAGNIVDWTHARCRIRNLKILRAPGDEASLVLGVGRLAAWASRRSLAVFARAEDRDPLHLRLRSGRFARGIAACMVLLCFATIVAVASMSTGRSAGSAVSPGVVAAGVLLIGTLIVGTRLFDRYFFGLAGLAFVLATVLNGFLIGASMSRTARDAMDLPGPPASWLVSILLALSTEMRAEPSPEGEWRVDTVPSRREAPPDALAHSIYDHPVAIERVVAWMRETIA